MRRAALCALGGVLIMGCGAVLAFILFVVAAFRVLLAGFAGGGRALLLALAIGLGAQLVGTVLLRRGAWLMRRAMPAAAPPDAAPRARRHPVTIDGEVVDRHGDEPPRPDRV
jgi:hypothetical protein